MTKKTEYSRRSVVKLGTQVPVVAATAGLLTACGGEEVALCANPNSLSFSENSIRQASNYTESSPHADKNCLNCAFFTAEPADANGEIPNCGHCSIFEGLAAKTSYCDSWSTKDTQQS
jgi:hypothetical protein